MQITIKDIAKMLNISVSTVSRALKNHPDISQETKDKVNEVARKLNYRPNALALGLKSNRSNTIGVIIPEVVHFFFSSVVSGIEDLAYEAGYNVMLCQTNEMYEREVMVAQALLDHRVDGVLVSVAKSTVKYDHLERFLGNKTPIVFFDRMSPSIDTDAVIVDDLKGAYLATKHLISVGCKNIIHLAAPENLLIGKLRKEGYAQALIEHDFPVDPENIYLCDTPEKVAGKIDRILSKNQKPDGIFAVNDSTAIAIIQALQKAGLNVPRDIAVCGFGDGPLATIVNPKLTTVEQNGYGIGFESTRFLLERITNNYNSNVSRKKVFTPELKVRESTARL